MLRSRPHQNAVHRRNLGSTASRTLNAPSHHPEQLSLSLRPPEAFPAFTLGVTGTGTACTASACWRKQGGDITLRTQLIVGSRAAAYSAASSSEKLVFLLLPLAILDIQNRRYMRAVPRRTRARCALCPLSFAPWAGAVDDPKPGRMQP